jgi:UDP-N-acetylglucosamine diphosphorylase/glucosamine-1-phosphate N-acetyltransferase
MTAQAYLFDHPDLRDLFLPFSLSRPLGELRYGAFLLRERWSALLGRPVSGHLSSSHLADFAEPGAAPVVTRPGEPNTSRLVMLSTFVPSADAALPADVADPLRFVDGTGALVGIALPRRVQWGGWAAPQDWPAATLPGKRLAGVWDLIGDLPTVLPDDLHRLLAEHDDRAVPRGVTILGDPALVVTAGAAVEPQAVLDVRKGPIVLAPGVDVRAMTRLAGPLAVARDTRVLGGQISGSAIGPRCVVNGEVTSSVFLGYANKAHDGFLGHSVLGRWVNLGAGTITSNLKNTYGPIRITLHGVRHETGLVNLGTLFGDHVKTAIGTMLPTGCVIGVGANLFGTTRPSADIAPFAWGLDAPGPVLEAGRFVEIAARILPRRDVPVDDATRRYLAALWGTATRETPCG